MILNKNLKFVFFSIFFALTLSSLFYYSKPKYTSSYQIVYSLDPVLSMIDSSSNSYSDKGFTNGITLAYTVIRSNRKIILDNFANKNNFNLTYFNYINENDKNPLNENNTIIINFSSKDFNEKNVKLNLIKKNVNKIIDEENEEIKKIFEDNFMKIKNQSVMLDSFYENLENKKIVEKDIIILKRNIFITDKLYEYIKSKEKILNIYFEEISSKEKNIKIHLPSLIASFLTSFIFLFLILKFISNRKLLKLISS